MDEIHFSSIHVFVALLVVSVAITFFSLGAKYCNCKSVEHRFIPKDDELIGDDTNASDVFKLLT
jgi:hypothetical protein